MSWSEEDSWWYHDDWNYDEHDWSWSVDQVGWENEQYGQDWSRNEDQSWSWNENATWDEAHENEGREQKKGEGSSPTVGSLTLHAVFREFSEENEVFQCRFRRPRSRLWQAQQVAVRFVKGLNLVGAFVICEVCSLDPIRTLVKSPDLCALGI